MTAVATLPRAGNLVVRASDWEAGARPGERIRRFVDDASGHRTMLTAVEPGPLGVLHAHDEIEQIYVLEGDFFDDRDIGDAVFPGEIVSSTKPVAASADDNRVIGGRW